MKKFLIILTLMFCGIHGNIFASSSETQTSELNSVADESFSFDLWDYQEDIKNLTPYLILGMTWPYTYFVLGPLFHGNRDKTFAHAILAISLSIFFSIVNLNTPLELEIFVASLLPVILTGSVFYERYRSWFPYKLINTPPTTTFEQAKCILCLTEFTLENAAAVFACGHSVIHSKKIEDSCLGLTEFLKMYNNCPICRKVIAH